ncbi:craniofacial development protein 2-like [Drosophila biarmipes]|uniref:craniofacial development protein 2-like n=1 Tax=Drosophila biarmipes TaxID=125945 RepID=UPI0021CCD1D6|nr:craniofacial development protein 2-like [Drosophila biarmipes]
MSEPLIGKGIKWTGQGCSKRANCDIYYSCHAERREFGCGLVVTRRLRHHVSNFTPVSERLDTIRVKTRLFNFARTLRRRRRTMLLRIHIQTLPDHDVELILGDFNAKVGRKRIFDPTVGRFSLHETTSNNGLRLIDFAAARNMVVSSTRFRHFDIHKATWLSPDQKTRNQTDHVVIDGRHASSVMDVRTFRGVNIDSDHYLVAAKIRMRPS